MINKLKFKSVMMLIVIGFIVLSCDEDTELLNTGKKLNPAEGFELKSERDLMSSEIAKNLAINMDNRSLRSFIKNEAAKQFDGDDNFLIALTKDAEIHASQGRGGIRFKDLILPKGLAEGRETSGALDENPLTQVAVYVPNDEDIDTWDIDDALPLVAYVPDRDVIESIPAYRTDGSLIELSSENYPDEVVVIVSQNERIIGVPKGESFASGRIDCEGPQPILIDDQMDYFLKEDYYNTLALCGGGGTGGSGTGGGSTGGSTGGSGSSGCDRDSNGSKDNLHRLKFNSSSVYKDAKDGWFNNDMEIRVDILFGTQNGAISTLTKYFNKRQRDIKDLNWTGLNVEIVTWDKSVWGNAMLYTWLEDDGDGTTTTSYSWTSKFDDNNTATFSTSITIPKKHYNLGSSIVEYCDKTSGDGYTYNTGRMQFQVNQ